MTGYSLFTTDLDHCYCCGKKAIMIHAVFENNGNTNGNEEKRSIADGCIIPMCWACNVKLHLDPKKQSALKVEAQLIWEHAYPNKDFIKRYGRSYL